MQANFIVSLQRHSRSALLSTACFHCGPPVNKRSAKHSIPARRCLIVSSAKLSSPRSQPLNCVPNSTCVPFSSKATNRSCGKALSPRLDGGRPKAFTFASLSATSMVLPSRLTTRHPRYQTPCVSSCPIGRTNSSWMAFMTSHPSLFRACVMPDLPVTLYTPSGPSSQCTPTNSQPTTSPHLPPIHSPTP